MSRRLFDIAFAAFGLAISALPLAVIALLIKLSSPGPVIYRQRRIGRRGHPFWLYKLRTMYRDQSGSKVTVRRDWRITPIGRLLRRYKIDELPQLWNVLKGEMSVVGPRAEVEQFVLHYTPEQLRLLDGPPGLAGFSQLVYPHEGELLEGCSSPEDVYVRYVMPRKLAVDLQYETRRTFWSDLKLIAQLILLILGRTDHIDRSFQLPPSIKKTLSDIGPR